MWPWPSSTALSTPSGRPSAWEAGTILSPAPQMTRAGTSSRTSRHHLGLRAGGREGVPDRPESGGHAVDPLEGEQVVDQLAGDQRRVAEQLLDMGLQVLPALGRDEALEIVAVDLAAEPGAPDQGQRGDPRRRRPRDGERDGTAHRVADQMGGFDPERIREAGDDAGEETDRAVADILAGAAVSRQVERVDRPPGGERLMV